MPKVSIVIPAYNVEKYIAETLRCITNQTMQDIEIICINDASNDGTLHIMEQLAEEDCRIIIIDNTCNQGAAICRNIGIEESRGDYICFLDADDVYSVDLIKEEYETICRYDADIAVVHSVNFTGQLSDGDFQQYVNEFNWKEGCISVKQSGQAIIGAWNIAPWNKMYKKRFVDFYNLRYQDLDSSNDVFFGMMALFLAEKIVLVESYEPKVFHRKDSDTQISKKRTPSDAFLAFTKVHDAMKDWAIWDKYFHEYFEHFYNTILSEFVRCTNESANQQTYSYIATEGLQRLGLFEVMPEKCDNKEVYQRLYNFMHYPYNGAWFWNFEQLLQKNKYKVILKIKSYNLSGKKLTVWEAGVRADVFIEFCLDNNCDINFLVDKDVMKQGQHVSGMEIYSFEKVADLTDIVLVLNSCFYQEIKDNVKKMKANIEIFDLQQYLIIN